ncbi:MAG: hypothetical protein CMH32_01515 [Micavibrio sp.]|nr:hypothetical protein [Micavibrio sp.]HCK32633.1 hypothetical protein [Rhodospirillaceae bacterium]
MSVGFFIWFIVTVLILGFVWWSVRIQSLQKKAWKAYADKYDLDFKENKFFEAPSMQGYLEDYYIQAMEGLELDFGGRKKRPILLKLSLRHELPFTLFICKRSEQVVFQQVNMPERVKLKGEKGLKWDAKNLVGTDDTELALAYMTPERMEMVQKVLDVPYSRGAFISSMDEAFFILQMDKPLTDPRQLSAIFKRLSDAAIIMEVDAFLEPGNNLLGEDEEAATEEADADDSAAKSKESQAEELVEDTEESKTESAEADAATAASVSEPSTK